MMAQTQTAYRWKTSDLDRLPDDPLLQYEIIDGELFVSRRPHLHHARMMSNLVVNLHAVVRASGGEVLPEPGIVCGSEVENNVIPDMSAPAHRRTGLWTALRNACRSGRVSVPKRRPYLIATMIL